jgi:hypothetical protein
MDLQKIPLEDMCKVAAEVASAMGYAFGAVSEAMLALSRSFSNQAESLSQLQLESYWDFVPPRVRHLAFHHPKERIRKKNWNRMYRIRERSKYVTKNNSVER